MPATTEVRRILIKVDSKDSQKLQEIASRLGLMNQNVKSLASGVGLLKNIFTGYIGALGIREIARMSDEMQNLGNRLKIVSQAGEDNRKIMGDLLELANRTQQSVGDVAEVYVRLGTSLKSAHATSLQLQAVTEVLINSFRISGSTGTETAATIIQLSQAFASGTLRGQELRSVMLQNAELARLLRERFGAGLADKAEKGLISVTEVLKILRDNLERINKTAGTLTPTFEQTVIKAFNQAKIALYDLNIQFGLSEKFAKGVDIMVVSVTVLGRALSDLAKVIYNELDFKELATAGFVALSVFNPLAAAVILTGFAVAKTTNGVGDFIDKLRNLGAWLVQINVWVKELSFSIEKGLTKAIFKVGLGTDEMINDLAVDLDKINELKRLADDLGKPKYYTPINGGPQDQAKKALDEQKKAIDDLIKQYEKMAGAGEKVKKIKEILGDINKALQDGNITVGEYNDRLINFELYKLNREFREGKFDIFRYNEQFTKLKEQQMNREFRSNSQTVEEFNKKISELKIEELTAKVEAGKIGWVEYNNELVKVSQKFEPGGALVSGTNSYLEKIGSTSSQVADAISSTFSRLEDGLVEFTKRGKFNFAEFTQAVLDDLTRIIIRASIIQPIANALLNVGASTAGAGSYGSAGGSYTNTGAVAAHGLAFDGGLKKFAKGGVVDGPTAFRYGGGRGLMGEAGPEAIIPLTRGSGGDLGVKATVTPVTVNIINQSGAEVQSNETTGPNGEKTIDILITTRVRDGLMTGKYDSAMKSAYGIQRRGS